MLDIKEFLDVQEHSILAKSECSITIDRTEFRESDITESADTITIPPVFDVFIKEKNDSINVIFPYSEIQLKKTKDIDDNGKIITINYDPEDIIIDQKYVDKTIDLKMVDRILNGRLTSVKEPVAILKLIKEAFPAADIVHIEVIISQMFRDKNGNLSRITGKYDEVWGVQKISKNESWLSAMSYQDINRGIKMGLVTGKDAKMNPVEKVISGKFNEL
jgi:hypothetical protein